MRRVDQVRFTDWAIRLLVTATFFAFFFAPDRWIFRLAFANFVAVGLWALVYPEGVLGWAKTAHSQIDVNDSSSWWVPRLIGAFFLFFAVVLATSTLR